MESIKIGRTSYNLDALKGMTKTAFLKGGLGHTLDAWEELKQHLPQPKIEVEKIVVPKIKKKKDTE